MQKNFPGEERSEGYIHCMYMLSRGNRVQGMFSVFHYVNLRNLNLPETPPPFGPLMRSVHFTSALPEVAFFITLKLILTTCALYRRIFVCLQTIWLNIKPL